MRRSCQEVGQRWQAWRAIAVVFNPHKRLRFAKLDHGEDNDIKGDEQALGNLMDKVLGWRRSLQDGAGAEVAGLGGAAACGRQEV